MKLKIIITTLLALTDLSFAPKTVLADTLENEGGLGCSTGLGPIADFLCKNLYTQAPEHSSQQVGIKLNQVLSSIIGFLTIIAALWFIFQIITAGYQWIGAGGDKTSLEGAQKKLTNSVIGLVIVASAYVIIGVIGKMLGLDILNPGAVIQTLGL